jgi:hypothetical protein
MMGWARHVARMGEVRIKYLFLEKISERIRLFRKPMRKWEDINKMDLRGIG